MNTLATLFIVVLAIAGNIAMPTFQPSDMAGWKGCLADGSFATIMNVTEIFLDPSPLVIGGTGTLDFSGTLNEALIEGAEARVEVLVFGLSVKTFPVNLCKAGQRCPIPAGRSVHVSKTLPINANTPPLKGATLRIKFFNGGDDKPVIGCAETKIDIVASS